MFKNSLYLVAMLLSGVGAGAVVAQAPVTLPGKPAPTAVADTAPKATVPASLLTGSKAPVAPATPASVAPAPTTVAAPQPVAKPAVTASAPAAKAMMAGPDTANKPASATSAKAPPAAVKANRASTPKPAESSAAPAVPVTMPARVDETNNTALYDELARTNAELQVMKSRLQKLTVDLELATKANELRRLSGQDNATPRGVPSVSSIEGVGDRLVATLVFSNGMTLGVHSGDTLPDGTKIARIEASVVVANVRGRTARWPLSLSKTQPFSFDTPAAVPPRPPVGDSTSIPLLPPPAPSVPGAPRAAPATPGSTPLATN